MATANENIRNALIRHHIGVIRASGTPSRKIVALLRGTEKELRAKIKKRLDRIRERGIDVGPETTKRLLDLEAALRDTLKVPQREITAEIKGFLTGAATREPVFVKDLINREIPVVVGFGLSRLKPAYLARTHAGAITATP